MPLVHFASWTLPIAVLVMGSTAACGQNFPNRTIRLFTTEAGGGADFVARLIAQGLGSSMGQPVIVENRGGGVVAGELVAKASPDGYTLLLQGTAFLLAPFLRSSVPFDPVRDFAPLTLADRSPNVLVVHPSLPIRSVKELIALAKARPGELNYASGSTGASTQLAAELFNTMAGVKITRINYRGTAPALNDLIGGQVQLMFTTAGAGSAHIRSGRLKALAVTSAQPSALAPGLPTVAASGLPNYEAVSLHVIFAPAKTPAAIVNQLNQEMVRVLKTPETREKFLAVGVESVGSTPEELAATVKTELAKWGKVIRDAGIKPE